MRIYTRTRPHRGAKLPCAVCTASDLEGVNHGVPWHIRDDLTILADTVGKIVWVYGPNGKVRGRVKPFMGGKGGG